MELRAKMEKLAVTQAGEDSERLRKLKELELEKGVSYKTFLDLHAREWGPNAKPPHPGTTVVDVRTTKCRFG